MRNNSRMALLLAGLPGIDTWRTVISYASGMSATIASVRAIMAGDGHLFIN